MKAKNKRKIFLYYPLCEDFSLGQAILKYLSNLPYMLSLIITALLSYGYFIVKETITIDSLSNDRYNSGILFAQGRLISPLISKIFMEQTNNYSFTNIFGLLLIMLSVIIICCVFEKIFKPKTIVPAVAFSCVYVSYPLNFEYYDFSGSLLLSGFCMCLLSVSLYLILTKKSKFERFYLPLILLALMESSYETFTFAFVCLVCICLIPLVTDKCDLKNKIGYLIHSAIVVVCALVVEYIISTSAISLRGVEQDYHADKNIFWFEASFLEGIKTLFKSFVLFWNSKVFCYLPFTILFVAGVIFTAIFIGEITKKSNNKLAVLLSYGAVFASIFAFFVVKGGSCCYRGETTFPVFVGFVMYLLLLKTENKKSVIKGICIAFVGVLILSQAMSCDYWNRLQNRAYNAEKQVICTVDMIVTERYGKSKPVVFIGAYQLPDDIKEKDQIKDNTIAKRIYDFGLKMEGRLFYNAEYKITDTKMRSYLAWAEKPFNDPNEEIYKFAEYHGCYFVHAQKQQYYEAAEKYADLPNWPDKQSVFDAGDYIVVKLGDVKE